MYWLLDIAVVLLLVLFAIWGFRRGLANKLLAIIAVLLLIVVGVALGPVFLLLFYKVGGLAGLSYAFLSLIGETNSLFQLMNITSAQVSEILAAFILLVIGWIIGGIIATSLYRLVRKGIDAIPSGKGVFGIINGILGLILYVAFYAAILLAVFALVSVLANKDEPIEFFQRIGMFIDSCSISGLIYRINPLVSLLGGLFN